MKKNIAEILQSTAERDHYTVDTGVSGDVHLVGHNLRTHIAELEKRTTVISEGDAINQIPAGTAFADLPEQWCCPGCEAAKERFLLLDDGHD